MAKLEAGSEEWSGGIDSPLSRKVVLIASFAVTTWDFK